METLKELFTILQNNIDYCNVGIHVFNTDESHFEERIWVHTSDGMRFNILKEQVCSPEEVREYSDV